jgi:hypothetical protein
MEVGDIVLNLFKNGKTLPEIKEYLKKEYNISLSLVEINSLIKEKEKKKSKSKDDKEERNWVEIRLKAKAKGSLGLKSLLKDLEKIAKQIEEGEIEKAYEKIWSLKLTVEEKLKKIEKQKEEENKEELKELVDWYIRVWRDKGELPPESIKLNLIELRAFAKKKFKQLLKTLTEEEIKELYKFWIDLKEEALPKEIRYNYFFKPIFIPKKYRGLNIFLKYVDRIKALKEELRKKERIQAETPDILDLL